jgi:hypothetical protein
VLDLIEAASDKILAKLWIKLPEQKRRYNTLRVIWLF